MEFRLLGVVEALEHGLPVSLGGPKQKSLLAMLLLDANHTVSTDRLVDGLWGDEPPQRAAATIHVYVSKLRKIVEPDRSPRAEPTVLLTQPPGYVLAVDPADVDLFRFDAMVAVARGLLADGCAVGGAVLLREALALWREAPLADLADEPFARFEVARLEEARTGAVEDRIDADLAIGRAVELLPELEALVARHPYRERPHRQLMLAQYRAGQQADALAAYQRARDALVDDLGLEPSRDLREMESAILVQDPELGWSEPRPITAEEAARVLRAVTLAEPDEHDVATVLDAARASARRAEDALRRAIDGERTTRLSATVDAATASHMELERARRVIVDGVLDRRVRQVPRRAPARHGAATTTVMGACPYKGLLRFEPEDADWYFGRERLVAELLASVASSRGVGIVGASGSGKSSLTRAGLVAALRDDALPGSAQWPRLLVTPGTDPVLELARGLAPMSHAASAEHVRDQLLDDPESIGVFASRAVVAQGDHASVMIVVDQLEEVFTVCRDEALAARFLEVLVHAASDPDAPTKLLAAIRADYYGHCAQHADFAEMLGRANVLVGPMRPDELQRAIEEPARVAGLVLEDGLVDRILDDVGTEPGSLPLLETALLETWNRRDGNVLTVDGYESSGGVRGAVAHLADDVYGRMSPSEQAIVRGIFLRLAEPGVGTDDVRRRAPLDELLVDDEYAQVLGTLVEHRLVVTSDVAAEVSHEALLREWPRLRGWLEEDREGRRVQRALSNAAQDWVTADRNDDLLFRGTRLAAALDVADAHPAEINPVERDFLGASRAHQDIELRAAQRTAHRLRRLTVGMAVVLVVALIAGVFSIVQRSRASDNAARAEQTAIAAEAERLATESRAQAKDQPGLALLLALEARRVHASPVTEGALETALLAVPAGIQRVFDFGARDTWTFDPGGARRTIAPGIDNQSLGIFNAATGKYVRQLHGLTGGTSVRAAVSPDHRWAASGSSGGIVTVWDAKTGKVVDRFDTGTGHPSFDTFDPADPSRLFVTGWDGRVVVLDLEHPSSSPVELYRAPASTSEQFGDVLTVSADGTVVGVSGPVAGPTHIVDAHSGALRTVVPGTVGDFSADGSVVLTTVPGGVQRWDTGSAAAVGALMTASTGLAPLATFSPDGRHVAVGVPPESAVYVYDAERGGPPVLTVDAHNSLPLPYWRTDGLLVVQGGVGAVTVRVDSDLPPFAVPLPPSAPAYVIPTARSDRFFTLAAEVVRSVDADSGVVLDRIPDPGGDPAEFVWPSPDGRFVAVGMPAYPPEQNEPITVYERGRAKPLGVIEKDPGDPPGRFWSPDSKTLLVMHQGTVDLWRVRRGSLERYARLHPEGERSDPSERILFDFSPDGHTIVIGRGQAGIATFFDLASGRRTGVYRLGKNLSMSALRYSPDGRTIAIAATQLRDSRSSVLMLDADSLDVRSRSTLPVLAQELVFLRGGTTFATATLSSTMAPIVSLWDSATFTQLGVSLDGPPGGWGGMVASPDGRRLAVGTSTGAVAYTVDVRSWGETACAIAGRTLTRPEWKHYLPGRPYDPACA